MGFRYYDPVSGRWNETTADHAPLGYLGYPWTPPSQVPRKVRDLAKFPIEATLMLGWPIMGYTPVGDKVIGAFRSYAAVGAGAFLSSVNSLNINWRRTSRSGGGSKEAWGRHWGALAFHHVVDPTGGLAGWTIIMQDLVMATFASGNAWVHFGSFSFNTAADQTSLVGVGWRSNNTDGYWTSTLRDGTGTPSTVLHETAQTAVTSTVPRRLVTVIDAASKSILWYADGVLVDTYTPAAPISQMTNVPNFGYFGITETSANAGLNHFGGCNPRVLTMLKVA